MDIKHATTEDIAAIAAVEAECFPPAEAATEKEFIERVKYYGNHFWLMYEDGAWQMIFGVNTLPDYRRHGYAGKLIRCAIDEARQQGRKGLVLTCKEKLIPYYAKFGFSDEGVSDKSTHGNVVWHQMRLVFS